MNFKTEFDPQFDVRIFRSGLNTNPLNTIDKDKLMARSTGLLNRVKSSHRSHLVDREIFLDWQTHSELYEIKRNLLRHLIQKSQTGRLGLKLKSPLTFNAEKVTAFLWRVKRDGLSIFGLSV